MVVTVRRTSPAAWDFSRGYQCPYLCCPFALKPVGVSCNHGHCIMMTYFRHCLWLLFHSLVKILYNIYKCLMAIGTFFLFHLDPDLPGDHFCCTSYLHLFVHIGQCCIWGTFSFVCNDGVFFSLHSSPLLPSVHFYRLLYMSGWDCMVVTKITEGFTLEPFYAGFSRAWSRYFVCLLAFFIAALYLLPVWKTSSFFTCFFGLLFTFVLFFDLCAIFSCLSVSFAVILLESPSWHFSFHSDTACWFYTI